MSHPADAWMPFYGTDFFDSERVASIEPMAQYLYLRMLWRQWVHGSLPGDQRSLLNIFPAFAVDWPTVWPQVSPFFEAGEDGRLRNPRCTFEREQAEKRIESSSDKAKRAAECMWAKRKQRESAAQALLKQSTSTAPGIPVPSGQSGSSGQKNRPPSASVSTRGKTGPRPPTAIEAIWYDERARVDPRADGKLTAKQAIDLNTLHGQHGPERLRAVIRVQLSDRTPFGVANANPSYLASHWDAVAAKLRPGLFTAPPAIAPERIARIKRALSKGEPADRQSDDYSRWAIAKQEAIDLKLTKEQLDACA